MPYLSNNTSMVSGSELPMPNVSSKELLFPAFNTLVPLFFECTMPHLSKSKNMSDVQVLIGAVHQMISFAFKTQIFNKVIWKQIQKLLQSNPNGDFINVEDHQVALMAQLTATQSNAHLPLRLKFEVKSPAVLERIRQL